MRTLRIFVSSPGDVSDERARARAVIERVGRYFEGQARLVPVLWEDAPLRATASFQQGVDEQVDLGQIDLVVFLLWSRLGTPLGAAYRQDGRDRTGTEWEFEQALAAHRSQKQPDLLVYKRTAEPRLPSLKADPEGFREATRQWEALQGFFQRWFRGEGGELSAAFQTYGTSEGFEERFERHLRTWVAQRLARGASGGPAWSGSPFRGLLAFDVEHAPVFFGRARATFEATQALAAQAARGRAFLVILGASGAGKSSLARAGLLARLTRPRDVEPEAGEGFVVRAVFRPGDGATPFVSLVEGLLHPGALGPGPGGAAALSERRRDLVRSFRESAAAAVTFVRERLAARAEERVEPDGVRPAARLLLLVDQAEELFTRILAPEDRRAFARVLAGLATSGVTWVILTLRNDFYGRLAEVPELLDLKGEAGHLDLLPMDAAELAEAVRAPAERAGLLYERREPSGEGLDDALIAAAARAPGALPLLQFTLEALHERREGARLTWRAYEALGGLEGALTRRAEGAFAAVDRETQAALPALVRSLVEVSARDDGALARRKPLLADLRRRPDVGRLVDALLEARLLESDKDLEGRPVVGVAHEALLTAWGRFAGSVAADRDLLQLRRRVEGQATYWKESARDASALLAEGVPLQDGERLLAADFLDLQRDTVAFVNASLEAAAARRRAAESARRRARRLKVGVVSGLVLTVAAVWVGLSWSAQRRREQEGRANASEARATARAKDEDARRLRGEHERLKAEVASEREAVFAAYAPTEKRAEFQAKERRVEALAAQLSRTVSEAREALEAAARFEAPFGGTSAETQAAFGAHFMERWRESQAAGDDLAAALAREQVERVAREAHQEELAGLNTLSVEVDPPDAEVYLFRYEDYETVRTDRPVLSRLVPVPTAGLGRLEPTEWVPGFCPGDRCLVVTDVDPKSPFSGRLKRGDLVLAIDGRTCGEGLYVVELAPDGAAAKAGVQPWDRIESADGRALEVIADWTQFPVAKEPGPTQLEVLVRRDGTQLRLAGPRNQKLAEATGIARFAEAPDLLARQPAPEGGITLACLHHGEALALTLLAGQAAGLTVERTAYPLILGRGLAHGLDDPATPRPCAPGSYLLYVRAPGREDQRYPVLVARGTEHPARARVRLLPAGTSPPGFVYVPPGVFLYGGDPEAFQSAPRQAIDMRQDPALKDGFWLARREVTWREWLEFVNDPATREGLPPERPDFLPRQSAGLLVSRGEDGRYGTPVGEIESPVLGISWNDLKAEKGYLAWRNGRAAAAGERWRYDLPSDPEWERAARGADGRTFPWGRRFDFGLCSSAYSRPYQAHVLRSGDIPEDESPLGLPELGGGRWEWCGTEFRPGSLTYVLRGGSWGYADPSSFRSATRYDYDPSSVDADGGARLVARPGP